MPLNSWRLTLFIALLTAAFRQHVHSYRLNAPPPLCSDYEMLVLNTQHCVARCPIRCINGVCFETDPCPCEGNYQTSHGKGLVCAADCVPGCRSAGGYCAAKDLCRCRKHGYFFDEVARRCRRFRPLGDLCRRRCLYGRCSDSGCICAQGYAKRDTLLGQFCAPICKQDCGTQGKCLLPNMCACRKKHMHYGADGRCHTHTLDLSETWLHLLS